MLSLIKSNFVIYITLSSLQKYTIALSLSIIWLFYNKATAAAQDGLMPELVKINKIETIGNTVFPDSELQKIIGPLPNRPVPLNKLYELRSKITNYYVKAGYISSGAFISPQQFSQGVVKIQVIEGVLTDLEVKGLSKINEKYISNRLPIGKPLNKNVLYKSLAKLNEDPLISNVSAELVRLTSYSNALILQVQEEQALQAQFNLNNAFSPSVGSLGGTVNAQYHLFGYGDIFAINYGLTQKSGLNRYGFSYILPFNANDGRISLSFDHADSKIVEEPIVSALDIQSDLNAYRLNIRQPVDLSVNSQLAFELGFDQIRTQSSINDVSFAFTEGLSDGEVKLSALRLAQEYSTRDQTNSFVARSQFSLGLDLFDATVTNTGIDGLFWAWQGQAQWQKKFHQVILVSNLNAQFSDDQLLPIEQFSLGGKTNIPGYRENLSLGDNGVSGTVEVQVPVLIFANRKGVLKIIPFVGAGTIWNNSKEEIIADTLVSTGLGLDLELDRRFQARINYGRPLINPDLPSDFSNQEITFDLTLQF
jgi:hemolysin activation/secretion protein